MSLESFIGGHFFDKHIRLRLLYMYNVHVYDHSKIITNDKLSHGHAPFL